MVKQNIVGALREQSDWEQNDEHRLGFIKNKPFYDNRKSEPLTIEWDGEVGDRETMDFMGFVYVKMANVAPSYDELCASIFDTTYHEDLEPIFSNTVFLDGAPEGYPFIALVVTMEEAEDGFPLCLIFQEDCSLEGFSYQKGLYLGKFVVTDEIVGFINSIHFPSVTTGELKTIDPKYLPVGGGLPFVEITSAPYPIAERLASEDSMAVPVSAEESEKLTKAASQGLPVIIKFLGNIGEGQIVPLCYVFNTMSVFFLETRSPYYEVNLSFACHDGVNWCMGA